MFHNTPNGLQLETENGWTISISLGYGTSTNQYCEIAVSVTGIDHQDNWVRWGANSIEPPDFPLFDRVYGGLTSSELVRITNQLCGMTKEEVQPNKWLSKGLAMEAKWR